MLPRLGQGQQQNAGAFTIPASMQGVNAVTGLAQMQPDECIYTFNLLAQDFGMEVRDGYIEWANGWTGGPARTVITFEGHVDADDKLWIANDEGIWEVTADGTTAPVEVFTWDSQVGNAGICSFLTTTNDGNDLFVLLCDGENGYHVYTQTTDTWAVILEGVTPGELDGVDPALLDFVFVWKNRIWFIQKETSIGWYLDAGNFTGDITEFNFGQQFASGGALRAMYNWSLDGGLGLDDLLVAVSSSGDVVVYQGTDPDAPDTFALIGTWHIGNMPEGNRFGVEFGGEVYLLSIYGLVPISQLLNGSNINDPNTYLTAKISPYIRNVMGEVRSDFGWNIVVHEKAARLFINSPKRTDNKEIAFSQYFGNQAWSFVRDLPKNHEANWRGEIYWVDNNRNKIFREAGALDAVFLDQVVDGLPAPIQWSLLTSYSAAGDAARYKRCQYIRPMFLSGSLPSFTVQARYDFDVAEQTVAPPLQADNPGQWDIDNWDEAIWGGGIEALDNPRGANGLGRHIAVNLRGQSGVATTLVSFDLIVDQGGLL